MLLPSGSDLCHLDQASAEPVDANHMYCTTLDGADFPPRNNTGQTQNTILVPGEAGQSTGGLQRANARLMLSADYAVTRNLLLGARVGYVLFAYDGQAAAADARTSRYGRLHLEARGTWVFGENPFGSPSVAPLVFAGAGISHFDANTSSSVTLTTGASAAVNIWKTDGPWFGTAGAGVRWAPIAELGLTLAARANLAFGNGAVWTFGPEVGVAYGF
jgi:hypothetical protein